MLKEGSVVGNEQSKQGSALGSEQNPQGSALESDVTESADEDLPDPKTLYVIDGLSLRDIAAQYPGQVGYSRRTLSRRSAREQWPELREQYLIERRLRMDGARPPAAPAVQPDLGGAIDGVAPQSGPGSVASGTTTTPGGDRAERLTQAWDSALQSAMLALEDARKLLLADRIRLIPEGEGKLVAEMKNSLKDRQMAMRIHAAGVEALRKLETPQGAAELHRRQCDKLDAEIELLRRRTQGNSQDVQDAIPSAEELFQSLQGLRAKA